MGARNAKSVLGNWAGHLDDGALVVLLFMALIALDKDNPPHFWGGWESIAMGALGRKPDTASEQSVKRRVRHLVDAGAITRTTRGQIGQRSVYRLNLERGSPSDPQRVSSSDPHVGVIQ